MPHRPECKFLGYVKVEILTHHPRRWTWSVCKDVNHTPVLVAKGPLSCAQSAWDAGSKALKALERDLVTGDTAVPTTLLPPPLIRQHRGSQRRSRKACFGIQL